MKYHLQKACPVCKSEGVKYLARGFGDDRKLHHILGIEFVRSRWFHCNRCNHVFLNPIFSAEINAKLYEGEGLYRKYSLAGKSEIEYLREIDSNIPTMKFSEGLRRDFFNAAKSFCTQSNSNISVIDFGAGFGTSQAFIRGEDVDYCGVEIDLWCLEIAKKYSRQVVTPEHIGDEKYDLVFSWQVFEHIQDPNQGIQQAVYYLKPGGIVAINVPTHSLGLRGGAGDLGGLRCLNWTHFHSYTLESLNILFLRNNVEVVHQSRKNGDAFIIGRYNPQSESRQGPTSSANHSTSFESAKIYFYFLLGMIFRPFQILRSKAAEYTFLKAIYLYIKRWCSSMLDRK